MSRRVARHRGNFNRLRFLAPRAKSTIIIPTAAVGLLSPRHTALISIRSVRVCTSLSLRYIPFAIFFSRCSPPSILLSFLYSFSIVCYSFLLSISFVFSLFVRSGCTRAICYFSAPFGLLVFTVNRVLCKCPGQRACIHRGCRPEKGRGRQLRALKYISSVVFRFVTRSLFSTVYEPIGIPGLFASRPRRGFRKRYLCSSEPIDFLESFQPDRSFLKR